MQPLLQQGLIVKPSLIHGYGVFADKLFEPESIIEECCAIISSGHDDALENYYFQSKEICLIAGGCALLYNHATVPNARYYFDETRQLLIFRALRCIQAGEEILISYGKNWFSCRGLPIKKIPRWRQWLRFLKGTPLRITLITTILLLVNQWLHG